MPGETLCVRRSRPPALMGEPAVGLQRVFIDTSELYPFTIMDLLLTGVTLQPPLRSRA